mmetsp:Transcript_41785/g.67788  ORF Transcript_41785/g.67788 Transcript_41785/m.67788 type:complete len:480 (+) Transcript_41785:114-1553(+)
MHVYITLLFFVASTAFAFSPLPPAEECFARNWGRIHHNEDYAVALSSECGNVIQPYAYDHISENIFDRNFPPERAAFVVATAELTVFRSPVTHLAQRLRFSLLVDTSDSSDAIVYFQMHHPVVPFPDPSSPIPPSRSFFYNVSVSQGALTDIDLPGCYDETLPETTSIWVYIVMRAKLKSFHVEYSFRSSLLACNETGPYSPGVFGDPHIRTFDGLTVTYTGCGDVVMAESQDKSFQYQSRHCLRGYDASSTCAIAVKCSVDMPAVEIYSSGTEEKVYVGATFVVLPTISEYNAGGGVRIKRDQSLYTVTCASRFKLVVSVRGSSREENYLDVELGVPWTLFGKLTGLLGTWDSNPENDILYRGGIIWPSGQGLDYVSAVENPSLSNVQNSWKVTADENLFTLTPNQSGALCDAVLTRRLLGENNFALDNELRTDALKACSDMGMSAVWLKTCIFDFIATRGDLEVLRNHALARASMEK